MLKQLLLILTIVAIATCNRRYGDTDRARERKETAAVAAAPEATEDEDREATVEKAKDFGAANCERKKKQGCLDCQRCC